MRRSWWGRREFQGFYPFEPGTTGVLVQENPSPASYQARLRPPPCMEPPPGFPGGLAYSNPGPPAYKAGALPAELRVYAV